MSVLDLLFPERCVACDAFIDAPGLCEVCTTSLYAVGPSCPVCGEPQEAPLAVRCFRCVATPPPFSRVTAPWRYGGELATAITRMKYGRRRWLCRGLAALVRPLWRVAPGEVVVPVPLHPRRLRRRGFSQAHEVARALGGFTDLLVRTRETAEQAGLSRAERLSNVAGAFQARRRIDGRRAILVDDVVTTGATAAACARALRAAGASDVAVFAVARAES